MLPGDSVLMRVASNWLFERSLELANKFINKEITLEELNEKVPHLISDCADHFADLLNEDRWVDIYEEWYKELHNPIIEQGSNIDAVFFGTQIADDGSKTAEDAWTALFPNFKTWFGAAHEVLRYTSLKFNIRSPKLVMATDIIGGDFNSQQAVDEVMIPAVGKKNMWGVTGLPASPLSAKFQNLHSDSLFGGHVFYIGNHYRAQTQGASGTLTEALHDLLPVLLALRFYEDAPDEHPLGLNLTPEDIKYLKLLSKDMMLSDAKRIIGVNDHFGKSETTVSKAIVKRGKFKAWQLLQAPINKAINLFYVWLIFVTASAPFIFLGSHLVNLPTHGWLASFGLHNLDFVITACFGLGFSMIYRKLTGYKTNVNMGQPSNITTIAKDSFASPQAIFLRVGFSQAFPGWGTEVHGTSYTDAIHYYSMTKSRGSWNFAHIPMQLHGIKDSEQNQFQSAKHALIQMKITQTGTQGTRWFKGNAINFTTSRGSIHDSDHNYSDYNIDIGGTEYTPPQGTSTTALRVWNMFDAWGGNLAFVMESSVMLDHHSLKGLASNPTRSVSQALVPSTESGQPVPQIAKVAPPTLPQDNELPETVTKVDVNIDPAMTVNRHLSNPSHDGGIDMNSRLLRLNVSGETQNRMTTSDQAMVLPVIYGVKPKVSQIVTVTPEMLKDMLGSGYLN